LVYSTSRVNCIGYAVSKERVIMDDMSWWRKEEVVVYFKILSLTFAWRDRKMTAIPN
jgi:hypothetical protein